MKKIYVYSIKTLNMLYNESELFWGVYNENKKNIIYWGVNARTGIVGIKSRVPLLDEINKLDIHPKVLTVTKNIITVPNKGKITGISINDEWEHISVSREYCQEKSYKTTLKRIKKLIAICSGFEGTAYLTFD